MNSRYTEEPAHGFAFENQLKAVFPNAANKGRSYSSLFDIEKEFDRDLGLPTSIKSTGSNIIALSDATRFFNINEPFRLFVLQYEQDENYKTPIVLHEYFPTVQELALLKGDLSAKTVKNFHESIKEFKIDDHEKGRQWSQNRKKELSVKYPNCKIILNPKLDSKTQRRLQASIRLSELDKNICLKQQYIADTNGIIEYCGFSIGRFRSKERHLK